MAPERLPSPPVAGGPPGAEAKPQVPWGSGAVGQGWLRSALCPAFPSFASDNFATRRRRVREKRRAGFVRLCPLVPGLVTAISALPRAVCPLGSHRCVEGAGRAFPDQGSAVQPQHRPGRQGGSQSRAEEMVRRVEWLIPSFLLLLSRLIFQLCEEKKGKISEKSFKKDNWRVDEQFPEREGSKSPRAGLKQ